jgi:hypothetical protein
MKYSLLRHARAAIVAGAETLKTHGLRTLAVPAVAALVAVIAFLVSGISLESLLSLPLMLGITRDEIATTIAAEVSETFKRVYLHAVDAVPDSNPLTAQLNKTRKFKGAPDGLYFSVKMETGGAVANVGDGQLLPRASRPQRKTGKSTLCHTYTVVAVGGQSVPLTKDNRNAFVSNLEEQFEDGMIRVKNDLERQYNGDGRGILCVILTVAGAPTYGVEKPYGATGAGPGTMILIEGADIVFINPGTGLERATRVKLNDVNVDTNAITTSAAVAAAAIGDYVVLSNDPAATGTDAANNYLVEAAGIMALCKDNDTFENIPGATERRWRAVVMAAGGAATEKMLGTLDARIRTRSGKKPSLYYTTAGIILSLQETLANRRQYTGETLELKGGYDGLKMNNRTVLEGPWCPKGHLFGLNTEKETVGMVDVVKMGYVDLDGAKLHRVEGRHAWRADLYFAHQALWFSRSAHGVINTLTDDNTIVR